MATRSHAKFEQKLTLGSKNGMKNLVNFHPATQNSKNFTSVGYFCLKYMRFELIKYRGVIFHDTEQWCKHWAKVSLHGAIFSCACNAICCVACAWKNCTVSHRCFYVPCNKILWKNVAATCNKIESILCCCTFMEADCHIFLINVVYQKIYFGYTWYIKWYTWYIKFLTLIY